MEKRISIEGMTCSHCAMSVKNALTAIEGVGTVEVDLEKRTAVVTSALAIPDETLVGAIAGAGYTTTAVEEG